MYPALKAMAYKLMYIPNNYTQNYPFCRLQYGHLKRLEPTNQNLLKFQKMSSQLIRKCYYKTFGTSVINSPMTPP